VALGKKPTHEAMRVGLAGNLCRCTGYTAIYRSIEAATGGDKNRIDVSGSRRPRRREGTK